MSITGDFGRSAASVSARFMEQGMVHVVASDTHDPERRSPALNRARDLVESRFGTEAAGLLFAENPRRIIEGLPVADGPLSQMQSRRWWQFWKSRSDLD
jgi:protein-tyrosine phosphatase